jgi:hypothetical protein
MHDTLLNPGWDTALVGIAFIGLLLLALFHVDLGSGASKKAGERRRPASGLDEEGAAYYTDPDGRRWKDRRKVKRPD